MTVRYRAEHVGSLLRPAELLAARAEFAAGRAAEADLRAVEDVSIGTALAMQREAGVDVYSDGEYRRLAWLSEVAAAIEGFVEVNLEMDWRGGEPGGDPRSTARVVGDRLRQRRRLTALEVDFLRANAPGPYKVTLPDPTWFTLSSWRRGISDSAYPRREDLLADLAGIVRSELAALAAEQVPYVQLDAPGFTMFLDERWRERLTEDGTDPDALFEACVAADVDCLQGMRRDGLTVGMHLCRGNSRSRWLAEGGYDRIAERLFSALPVDTWLLEYDSERSGGFAPLRHVPAEASVVLGLVTTKAGALEDPDELARRVEQAARYVDLDRLAISPQCGFASVAAGNTITADEQWRKLELVAATARRLWG